jgi:hypothetical protein
LTLAQTLGLAAAFVHILRHEPPAAAYAARTLRICEEHRIAEYHAIALCVNGWALSASGESESGLAQIGQGLASYSLGVNKHILLALQADAQLASGRPEAAHASAAAAGLEAAEKAGGSPPLEAELNRLRGEALLGAGTASKAETAMQQAIDIARRQNAKSWELRGATSLARLRHQQGRRKEAVAPARPHPRLVHRRLRHRRSERGKGAARRVDLSRRDSMRTTIVRSDSYLRRSRPRAETCTHSGSDRCSRPAVHQASIPSIECPGLTDGRATAALPLLRNAEGDEKTFEYIVHRIYQD